MTDNIELQIMEDEKFMEHERCWKRKRQNKRPRKEIQ
jgi:uncharacterized membrane protein